MSKTRDLTKFESDSFDDIPNSYIVQKSKINQSKIVYPIKRSGEFFDMFEMRQK